MEKKTTHDDTMEQNRTNDDTVKTPTTYDGVMDAKPSYVREPGPAYKKSKEQGDYTIEDYYALPDDRRVELIDGVIYDMATPTYIHQGIAGEIALQLKLYIRKKGGNCKVFSSPSDVQLDRDNKTMVEPDVMIVCNRDWIRTRVYYGAPDFVVEILSPSTRKRDMGLKFQKYKRAGVREYWMVDPDRKTVVVYDFEHDSLPVIYGFEDRIPVNIFNGACEVDFAEIYEEIRFLYEQK